MAHSCFMANGVEAGSAIAAQNSLGAESAVDLLKALRGSRLQWNVYIGCRYWYWRSGVVCRSAMTGFH